MAVQRAVDNAALCGSVSDLTNPDYCGKGVLGAFTAGAGLVIFHQIGLAVHPFISHPNLLYGTCLNRILGTRSFYFRKSVLASSLSLFDTASVLSISWGVAAAAQLTSHTSVQTTHDALMICLTSYASNGIALGALCTTSEHIRRNWYRLIFMSVSLVLCASTTGLVDHKIKNGKFPMEACLPFFTEYLPNMRKYFKVLTWVFWGCVFLMLVLLVEAFFSPTPRSESSQQGRSIFRRVTRFGRTFGIWLFLSVEFVLGTMIVMFNHYYVPEQVLRAQAGGQLAEGQWTFGQIIGMLIWLPVVAELIFILFFGTKRGQDNSLPISSVARLERIRSDPELGPEAIELIEDDDGQA